MRHTSTPALGQAKVAERTPAIAYGGTPDAFSVPAALRRSGHVFGGVTPAFLNAVTLYQTVDLLAPLKTIP